MLATSKRLRSSSPPSSPLDQVTKRRRQTSSSQQSAPSDDGQQARWAAAGPSGWKGDVPPNARRSSWEHLEGMGGPHDSPTSQPIAPSSSTTAHRQLYQPPTPSPLASSTNDLSYFPHYGSASNTQQYTSSQSTVRTPRASQGAAQHDSHAHHRNAPLFHPTFIDQHPPWSSSSSSSSAGMGHASGRPPDGMGLPGDFGPLLSPHEVASATSSRRTSIARVMREEEEEDLMEEDEDEQDWDSVEGTVQDNVGLLANSPYAGMNQLLHSLVRPFPPPSTLSKHRTWMLTVHLTLVRSQHRPRQPQPHMVSSPFPHAQHSHPTQMHTTTPQTPLDAPNGMSARTGLIEKESSATRLRYGDVNRQLGELVLGRRLGRGLDEGG